MSGFISRLTASGAQLTRGILGFTPGPMREAAAGFKVKARLKLRCKSCYFIRQNGRLHVECHEHPRHKAREVFNVKALW